MSGLGMRLGLRRFKKPQALSSNWLEWMGFPYFAIPENGVMLLVGNEVTIYGDSLINVPIVNDLSVTYTCDIGTQSGNNYIINPDSDDVGEHALTIIFKNANTLITQRTIILKVNALATAGTKKILMIGDSLLNSGNGYYSSQIITALSNCTITFLGIKGTTTKHEGHAGATWKRFVTNDQPILDPSPFVKNGVLDIAAYFTDNSIAIPDFVHIMLGVNDTFQHCAVNGDGLTNAEITTIINYAKTFVNAFLTFNSSLNIILALPTICENTGAGWNDDYTESSSQDLYIKNIHKFRVALVNEFANGNYDERVDCSYEAIFLDRNDGYPKTAGIHTSGVHPDQSGYEQIGKGMAFYFNRELTTPPTPPIPSGLTVEWVDDYAKIDFTDNSGGVSQHEIWESKNGEPYLLVTTLAAGVTTYNNYTWQNANMNFKIRAISGELASEFSDAVAISTPLVFKSNQTTLNNLVIAYLYISAGTVNIDWGDGTSNNYTGNTSNFTKVYNTQANPYFIKLTGSLANITGLSITNQTNAYGNISKWILPAAMQYIALSSNGFSGDMTNFVLPSTLKTLQLSGSYFTGNITDWVLPSNLETLLLSHSAAGVGYTGNISNWVLPNSLITFQISTASNTLTGDLSAMLLPSGLTRFYVLNQDFTKLPLTSSLAFDSSIGYYAKACNLTQASLDELLIAIDNFYFNHTPIKSSKFDFSGTGMASPSATGLSAKSGIEAKFTAAGFTASITVNP
jgi:lysophospholipase L1-like esterase